MNSLRTHTVLRAAPILRCLRAAESYRALQCRKLPFDLIFSRTVAVVLHWCVHLRTRRLMSGKLVREPSELL